MRKIYVGETPAQAHLVAGFLEVDGIDAVVEGDLLTGARFAIGADSSTLPTVYVRDEDVHRASDVLRAHMPEKPPALAAPRQEVAEGRSLGAFKWFLRLWLLWTAVGLGLALIYQPIAGAIFAAFVIFVGLLWRLARRR